MAVIGRKSKVCQVPILTVERRLGQTLPLPITVIIGIAQGRIILLVTQAMPPLTLSGRLPQLRPMMQVVPRRQVLSLPMMPMVPNTIALLRRMTPTEARTG